MAQQRKKITLPARQHRELSEDAFIRGRDLRQRSVKQTVSKTIRVTPGEFKAVQMRAIEEGINYSDVIRAAICKYVGIPFDKSAGAEN